MAAGAISPDGDERPEPRMASVVGRIPILVAGLTNLVLLVVEAIKGNLVLTIAALFGGVTVAVLDLGIQTTIRYSTRLQEQVGILGQQVSESARSWTSLQSYALASTQELKDDFATLDRYLRDSHGTSQLIGHEEFYERALSLIKSRKSAVGMVRAFNMYGFPPDDSPNRKTWLDYVSSEEFSQSGIHLQRIKFLGDERAFQWTLTLIRDALPNRRLSLGLLMRPDYTKIPPVLYPLNVHTYFTSEAFILCPGFAGETPPPNSVVIHVTNPGVVDQLERYQDSVYRTHATRLSSQGAVDIAECRKIATRFHFSSAKTLALLDEIQVNTLS